MPTLDAGFLRQYLVSGDGDRPGKLAHLFYFLSNIHGVKCGEGKILGDKLNTKE